MLCDHVSQERKTSTFLHDSGVFFSDVGQFMCRGWGSSVVSVVSVPILRSLVMRDEFGVCDGFGDIFEWVVCDGGWRGCHSVCTLRLPPVMVTLTKRRV